MKNGNEVAVAENKTPSDMIHYALEKGADLDKVEKLLVLKERWEAGEAKKAYHVAISEFKKNPPKVTKDKKNAQYKSMYTTLGNLVNTVNPELSKHGLSASWEIKQNGIIEVTCILTHNLGHSERTSMSAPADTSGAKNAIQQIKSTITYLKAVTFESIVGLASSDANYDDDGNAVGAEVISQKELSQLRDLMAEKNVSESKMCEYLKIDELEKMPKAYYQKALTAVKNAKGKQ